MATTTKKTTTKKAAPKKAAPKKTPTRATAAKKPATAVAKKAPAKSPAKAPAKKRVAAKKQPEKMRSFRIARDQPAFTTFQITRQTVYWIILVAFIIFAQLWILKLQVEVATLLDAQQTQLQDF